MDISGKQINNIKDAFLAHLYEGTGRPIALPPRHWQLLAFVQSFLLFLFFMCFIGKLLLPVVELFCMWPVLVVTKIKVVLGLKKSYLPTHT